MSMKKCNNCGKISPFRTDICDCGSMDFAEYDPNATKKVSDVLKGKAEEKKAEETVEEKKETKAEKKARLKAEAEAEKNAEGNPEENTDGE